MKWITATFPNLHIHGVAKFEDGVFRSTEVEVLARMTPWVGRYGITQVAEDSDPPDLPLRDPWPGAVLEAELDHLAAQKMANSASELATATITAARAALETAAVVRGAGIDYTGAADSTTAVQAIITAARTAERDVLFLPGILRLDGGLGTWDCTRHSLRSTGTTRLDMTQATGARMLDVIGQDTKGDTYGFRAAMHRMSGFRIEGPSADATTVDFCRMHDIANGSHPSFEHLFVTGFRDQWTWGDNVWCSTFRRVASGRAKRRVLYMGPATNTGENLQFVSSTFFSSTNLAGTATALYVDKAARSDINMVACSLDYNDLEFDINSGNTTFLGCHIENNKTATPIGKLSYTATFETTNVAIIGGKIVATETGTGRPHLLEIVDGQHAALDVRDAKWETFGKNSELAKIVAGTGRIDISGGMIPVGGGGVVQVPAVMSRLYNGSVDTGTLAGWAVSGPGSATVAASTEQFLDGTHSVLFTGTGAAGGDKFLKQRVACRPGQSALFTCDAKTDAYTAGDVLMLVAWYAADGTSLIREDGLTTRGRMNSTLATWTRKGDRVVAPAGAAFVDFTFRAGGALNGKVFVDNIRAGLV